jgi:phenylacetate-coenzyme A ligase PaaK-like adenylate-forming protein
VLTPETRRIIESAWGQVLFNEYAATETAGIAAECDHHDGLHLFEDLLIVEVVDEDYRPVPLGVYGAKLLVTVLFNFTQPLIRYEITDSVRLSSVTCPAGWPFQLIDDIQGRIEETLHFPAVNGGDVAVQPIAFARVLDSVPNGSWQLVQEAGGLRLLLAQVDEDFDTGALVSALRRMLEEQGALAPPIVVERVDAIPRSPAGKAPLIKAYRRPTNSLIRRHPHDSD